MKLTYAERNVLTALPRGVFAWTILGCYHDSVVSSLVEKKLIECVTGDLARWRITELGKRLKSS